MSHPQRSTGILRDFFQWSPTSVPLSILLVVFHGLSGSLLRAASAPSPVIIPAPSETAQPSALPLDPSLPLVANLAEDPAGSHASAEQRADVIADARSARNDFSRQGEIHSALNRGLALHLSYSPDGMRFSPRNLHPDPESWHVGFRTEALVIDGQTHGFPNIRRIETAGNRATGTLASGCDEWFVNRGEGVEHGYTIGRPDTPENPTAISMRIAVETPLLVESDPNSDGFVFRSASGRTVASYSGLVVRDSLGEELEASMSLVGSTAIHIDVDVAGASWPIEIDPTFAVQIREVLAADGGPGDRYGDSADGDDNTIIVGAPGKGAGAAYIQENDDSDENPFARQKKIVPPPSENPMVGDEFGKGVAVFVNRRTGKTYAAVGAPGHGEKGAIFVYERNQGGEGNWGFVEKVVPSGLSLGARFGCSVDIENDTMAVGAGGQNGSGAVYIYNLDGLNIGLTQTIDSIGNKPNAEFGHDVALSKNRIGIGAPGEDDDKGAGYVLERDLLNPLIFALAAIRFFSNHAVAGDRFAAAVVLTATMIAFGGPGVTGWPGGTQLVGRGAVWVFLFSVALATWVHFAVLWGQEANGFFGCTLAINRFNDLLVGAIGATSRDAVIAGAAFLFLFNPFLNAFDPPDRIVPQTFIDPGMQLGTAMVLLGTYFFLMGSAYSFDMGAMFILQLVVATLTFTQWLLLFYSQEEVDDPANMYRFRREEDDDGDRLPLGVEYKTGRSPIVPEFNTQKVRFNSEWNFKYSYQGNNAAGEGTPVIERWVDMEGWSSVDSAPPGTFMHMLRRVSLRTSFHHVTEEIPESPRLLLRYKVEF